ncbi:DUF4377 domain-containing protein [Shewanella donghaensis]|uniref:DUF4377 domain-containing protein n=1 Tax=Shewanella donghaensis TaxID=238836 RepID=UPI001181CC4C|nr:DUF4377 domain-containing protein [Shewanella donghaensis]
MKWTLPFAVLLITLCLLTGCSDSDSSDEQKLQREIWNVVGNPKLCHSVIPRFCLGYTLEGNDEEKILYAPVEGYNHTWGISDRIEIEISPISNPPADESNMKYTLLSIINNDTDPLGSIYTYNDVPFNPNTFIQKGDIFFILGYEVNCAAMLCSELLDLAENDVILNLEIKYNNEGEIIRWF